ncbi:MAG: tetratricopeptide repeat protein [Deltaproteobacteria bacterium]|nr:tetratricopeptide repeat protein [Deltaproteobacteria bacterium]
MNTSNSEKIQKAHDNKAKIQHASMLLKTGRIEEAEEHFQDVVKDFPDAVQGYAGLARVAQKVENWELALDRWAKVIEITPDHQNARIQYANMLMKTGHIEEAEECFQDIVKTFPDAIQGHSGLMKIARMQSDWDTALKAAELINEKCEQNRPLFAQMARIMILALVRSNRIKEAEEAVKRFESTDLPDKDKFFLTATMLQEQHRWMETLAWYRKHEKIVLLNPQLVFRYLNIILWCGFSAEAYGLLKRYLRGKPELKNRDRFQFISTLEKTGKVKLAVRWLLLLVTKQGPGILNKDMILLLASTLIQNKQYDRLLSFIGRIKTDETINANSIRCKFTALIFESLVNHLNQHHLTSYFEKGYGASDTDVTIWDQLDQQIRRLRNLNRFQQTYKTLDGFISSYQQIQEQFSEDNFLVNTFFNPWESYRLIYFIIDRIRRRQPTSLVRLGDCEGNFLPYPEEYIRYQAGDRKTCVSHWWETKLSLQDTTRISTELTKAINAADIIGIPEPARMVLDIPIPTPRKLPTVSVNWRGILTIFHNLNNYFRSDEISDLHSCILTASFVNYDLELWGGYDLILNAARSYSVICSYPEIARTLRDRFNIQPRRVIPIPPEKKLSHRAPDFSNRSHFPEFFEEFYRNFKVTEPGEVFLVAAGILGKSYCNWIKERGGIALDIGSMIDFWCGARTRKNSMHFRAAIGRSIQRQSLKNSQVPEFSIQPTSCHHLGHIRDAVNQNSKCEAPANSMVSMTIGKSGISPDIYEKDIYRTSETDRQERRGNPVPQSLSMQYRIIHEHFDHAYYRRRYADVASKEIDPVEHYLACGAKEGRDPTPDFDTKYYKKRYPDVGLSGLNPFYHYLEIGRKEGRSPCVFSAGNPLFDAFCTELLRREPGKVSAKLVETRCDLRNRLERGVLKEMVDHAATMEPLIRHSSLSAMDPGISPFRFRQLTARMLAMYRLHRDAQWRRASAVVVVHWSHMLSGAARFAGFITKALAEIYGPGEVVVLRTKATSEKFHNCFLPECRQIDFGRNSKILDANSSQQVFVEFLRSLRPMAVFNVNSALFWETMVSYGGLLAREMALYASLFSNTKTVHGEWTGYPARLFYRYFDLFRGVITDSYFLAEELNKQFLLTPKQQRKLVTLESPVIDIPRPVSMPTSNTKNRPRVFWASRFDREKRVDIVYTLANAMPDVDFYLWGKPVLDDSFSKWIKPKNVFLEGVYEKFENLPLNHCNVWLYTSECDGVPNVLIDVAASGIPIVGSLVGGTGEILIDDLSWPVRDSNNVKAYEQSLRQVLADPEAAWTKALRLREHVLHQRTWNNFVTKVKGLLP